MSAAVIQSFAFSRRSLLGVLHLLLAYWDAPSRRKYILLCGTDSRAFAFEQADSIASTNICNTWLCRHVYRPCARAYLQLDKTCRSVWTSPQSAHLESSTIPHFRRLSREGSWSYRDLITKDSRSGGILHRSMRLISVGPHPTLSTVPVGLAALLLWSWHFLYPFSSLGWLTPIFGRRWPVSTWWSDSSRFHDDRLGWGLVSPRSSELLLTFPFLLGRWIFSQIWAAAWIHILHCLWSCWSLTAFWSC